MSARRGLRPGQRLVLSVPVIWLGLFFVLPFLIVLKLSMSDPASVQPPYRPVFNLAGGPAAWLAFLGALDLENYVTALTDGLYFSALLTSLRIAAVGTLLTLLIGFPLARAIARAPENWRIPLLTLVILPCWTSFLIRIYAWIGILKQEGLLNQLLLWLGVIGQPLVILDTETAVLIGIAYAYLPFMVLPVYAALVRIDGTLLEAAADLGATPFAIFRRIVLPLAMPGIIAGSLLVFIPAVGEFIIPDLLGGSETLMLGRLLWTEFFNNRDWPLASTIAVMLLLVVLVPIGLYQRLDRRKDAA
jgi:putrescine transport system permease protein